MVTCRTILAIVNRVGIAVIAVNVCFLHPLGLLMGLEIVLPVIRDFTLTKARREIVGADQGPQQHKHKLQAKNWLRDE